jgi:hypothetical protein
MAARSALGFVREGKPAPHPATRNRGSDREAVHFGHRALHPDSALSSDTQRANFLQKTYFVESPSFGMRLPGLLPEDSSP